MSAIKMLAKEDETDLSVTWPDQQAINEFSRLNAKESDMSEQIAHHTTVLEDLEELSNELELADEGDPQLYKIGDAFLTLDTATALDRIQGEKERVQDKLNALKQSQRDAKDRMTELKAVLYGKFGNAINLER
jgi:prefoldin subunit 4